MERWSSLPVWLRISLVGAFGFALGAILAFAYSYRPLHGALAWKVEQLEARLDERNLENLRLTDEVKKFRQIEEERIDPATLAQVRAELDQTKYALNSAESKIERLDRRHKDAVAGSNRWRKRYEKLRDSAPNRTLPASPAPIASSPTPPQREAAPAAPMLSNAPLDPSESASESAMDSAPLSGPSLDATLPGEAIDAP